MPGNILTEASMNGGNALLSSGNGSCSVDINTPCPTGPANSATDTRLLQVQLVLAALTGGASPSVTMVTSRLEMDPTGGNPTGVVTAIDSPAALTVAGAITRNIGPNQAQAANLARTARITVTVAGGPTTCDWYLYAVASN